MTTLDSRWVAPDHATTDRADCLIAERQGGHVQTLERSYLLRINGMVVERPQHMLMRVAVGIHKEVPCSPGCCNHQVFPNTGVRSTINLMV